MVTTARSTSASPDTIVDVLAEESVLRDGTDSLDSSRQLTVSISQPPAGNFNPFGKWGYKTNANNPSGSILVEHGNSNRNTLNITLHRTIRVPDNADTNSLPPSLGSFPLFRVKDFTHNLPDELAQKGGIFFPMYQAEAMWMAFSASRPFALKIYVGGVNAVSGFPMVENEKTKEKRARMLKEGKEIQDYVVTPNQPWLDGIVSEDGKIRQFVAQPKGSGFSVEAQVTGEEKVGGIQIEIIPIKKNFPEEFDVRYKDKSAKVVTRTFKLQERGITSDSTWADVKKAISKEFGIEEAHQQLSQHTPAPNTAHTRIDFDDSLRLGDVYFPPKFSTLAVEHGLPPAPSFGMPRARYGGAFGAPASTGSIFGGSAPGGAPATVSLFGNFGPSGNAPPPAPPSGGGLFGMSANTSGSLFGAPAPGGAPATGGLFGASASGGAAATGSLFGNVESQAMAQPKMMQMQAQSCAAPAPPPAPMQTGGLFAMGANNVQPQPTGSSLFGSASTGNHSLFSTASAMKVARAKPKVNEMGLAAGGLIKQTINADPNPADVWDHDAAVLLHLQIFDPASYTDVTGNPAPPTPATQEEYAKHGWPYFELWNEEKTGVKGDFSDVKSVAQLKKERALAAGEDAPAEEESVPVRVVTIGGGRVACFKSTFRPLEVLRKEMEHLTLNK